MSKRILSAFSLLLIAAGVALMAGVLLTLSTSTPPRSVEFGPDDSTLTGFTTSFEPQVEELEPDEGAAGPTATPTDTVSDAPLARIRAPSVGIDAPLITLGVNSDGVMQTPDRPDVVAWYDFSGRPGAGSNVVLAGHLDFVNVGPAVFWRLGELREGDEVLIDLADGSTFVYRVVQARTYDAATAPVQDIVGPTDQELVTLITCAGSFSQTTGQYNDRLVVRAVLS